MRLFLILLMLVSSAVNAVDLREYFPDNYTVTLNRYDGTANARFAFRKAPSSYLPFYQQLLNQNKSGYHFIWKKDYFVDGAWKNATNAVLFMAEDKSVIEVGDWLATEDGYVALGYKTNDGKNTGLYWSPPGGITKQPSTYEMSVYTQLSPGSSYSDHGYDAYSRVGLVDILPTYAPPYGRDNNGEWRKGGSKEYTNVIRIVMYHGTKHNNVKQVRCSNLPVSANGPYYQSFKDYNSYAMDVFLAKGKGIVQMDVPFIEDATYWGWNNCTGAVFDTPYTWSIFIDEQ